MCGFQPGFWTLEELMQCHGMAAMQTLPYPTLYPIPYTL